MRLSLLDLFRERNDWFPDLPHTPTSEIRTLPFHLLEACMKKIKLDIPFGQSLLQRPQSLLVIFTDQVLLDPTFCGIFVCGPLQSFVVNVCTLILSMRDEWTAVTKNWDYLLEIFYRIEQWPSQCVLKSSVVAKIIRFERVRASAYISLDVSFMVTLWNHGIPSRPRSCSLFFISIC